MSRIWNRPLGFVDGLLDRICAIAGALAFAQFPQFYGQYLQRLGGHLDEARRALDQYVQAAEALNISLQEYIREHLESDSEIFEASGQIIQGLWERVQELEHSYQALQDATIFNRWWVFFQEVDWAIAARTWEHFTPGVPTTGEGLVYALAGLLVGWGLYSLLKAAVLIPARALATGKRRRDGKAGPPAPP